MNMEEVIHAIASAYDPAPFQRREEQYIKYEHTDRDRIASARNKARRALQNLSDAGFEIHSVRE